MLCEKRTQHCEHTVWEKDALRAYGAGKRAYRPGKKLSTVEVSGVYLGLLISDTTGSHISDVDGNKLHIPN